MPRLSESASADRRLTSLASLASSLLEAFMVHHPRALPPSPPCLLRSRLKAEAVKLASPSLSPQETRNWKEKMETQPFLKQIATMDGSFVLIGDELEVDHEAMTLLSYRYLFH